MLDVADRSHAAGLTSRQATVLGFIRDHYRSTGLPPTYREIGEGLQIRSTNGVSDHVRALMRKGFLGRLESDKGPLARALMLTPKGQAALAQGEGSGGEPHPSFREASGGGDVEGSSGRRHLRMVRGEVESPLRSPPPQGERSGGLEAGVVPLSGVEVEIPVLGRVAAGVPILADETQMGHVQVDSFLMGPSGRKVFALRVSGESMIQDGILDGDFILVQNTLQVHDGDVAVVMIDGEATVKRYYREGRRVRLQPANDAMHPIYLDAEAFRELQVLGIVVGVYRRLH